MKLGYWPVHDRSSKYATADDNASSSGGETGTGRRYPPRSDVLTGRVVVFSSEVGSSNGNVVEAGSSTSAVDEVATGSSDPCAGGMDACESTELYGGGTSSRLEGVEIRMMQFLIRYQIGTYLRVTG